MVWEGLDQQENKMETLINFAKEWYWVSMVAGFVCAGITLVGGLLFVKGLQSLDTIDEGFQGNDDG